MRWLAAALLAIVACHPQTVTEGERSSDLFPTGVELGKVQITAAGVSLEAKAEVTEIGNRRKISLVRDTSIVETEEYEVTDSEIALVAFGKGEGFSPPLSLGRFPLNLKEQYSWKGRMFTPEREMSARAIVQNEMSSVGAKEALLSTIELNIEGVGPRKMQVWFVQGLGPLKRDFGNQVREPKRDGKE